MYLTRMNSVRNSISIITLTHINIYDIIVIRCAMKQLNY